MLIKKLATLYPNLYSVIRGYSEFGLIVIIVTASQGWLASDWLVIMVVLSVTFTYEEGEGLLKHGVDKVFNVYTEAGAGFAW